MGSPTEGRACPTLELVLVAGNHAWHDSPRRMDHLDLGGSETVYPEELDDVERVDVQAKPYGR